MLSTTATSGELVPAFADAVWWLLVIGGDDIGSRVDIFEEVFLVFMALGTLVGIVVIAYTLKNAYKYRDGNDAADEPKGRPQLGELPTGAAKGGRKLFLSFGISAIIVVSLIAWTYGMLLVVEGQTPEEDSDDIQIQVEGWQFGWDFIYEDDERVPDQTAENLALAVDDPQMDVDSGDIERAVENDDVDGLLEDLRSQADEADNFSAGDFRSNTQRQATGMTDAGEFNGQSFLVPADRQIFLTITAQDVWHNFGISGLRVKADAIPGETSNTWFEADEPTTENPQIDEDGTVQSRDDLYVAECFELCGSGHSNMKAAVDVVPEDVYMEWYNGVTVSNENLDEVVEEHRDELEESTDDTSERMTTPATAGVIGA